MAYLLITENCKGSRMFYRTNADGEYEHAPDGGHFSGSLVLQRVDDTDTYRIFFGDAKNLLFGGVRKIFGLSSRNPFTILNAATRDYLCCFEFTDADMLLGKKHIEFHTEMMVEGYLLATCISCYDHETNRGFVYLLPVEARDEWQNQLGRFLKPEHIRD